MDKFIETELEKLVNSIFSYQPLLLKNRTLNKAVKDSMFELKRSFVSLNEQPIRESIFLFNQERMFEDKPLVYFIAIVRNKANELGRLKNKETKKLGSIPKNII
jgi:hypothetical protein